MCGIFISVRWQSSQGQEDTVYEHLCRKLRRANGDRGPDQQRSLHSVIESARATEIQPEHSGLLCVEFFASELRLRGDTPVVQPHEEGGDILCWNGEIFEGMSIAPNENDGVKLFRAIRALDSPNDIPQLFGGIEGPYAFAFFSANAQKLFFARDPLGRRSMLIHKPSMRNPWFLLASVSVGSDLGYEFEELSTDYIHCLDLAQLANAPIETAAFNSTLVGWPRNQEGPFAKLARVNTILPPDGPPHLESLNNIPPSLVPAVDGLISHLDKSVMLRVQDLPQLTGSERRARVAVLFSGGIDSTILCFLAHRHLPLDEPIDLLNVAFENPRKIQIQVEGNVGALPKKQKLERKRHRTEASGSCYNVPDRITGFEEVLELRRLCPGRTWNFVEVNVPYEESQSARSSIEAIMWPGRTVMDMSLAMALYFASRGIGQVRSCPTAPPTPYSSAARVLLNGLGSDELLGGYGRHRTAFNVGGWQAVIDELQLELDRLPTRNLGRDDRVISSHGKETRHPFLSLSVVSYLVQLPVHFKLDPRLDLGVGDKLLLRLAARKLGLVEASVRKKRAMQFGSHSARMEAGAGERRGDLLLQ